jgi:hypothetical protein
MSTETRARPASPYDLNALSEERLKAGQQTHSRSETRSPYTLASEGALGLLWEKAEKNNPK